MDTSSTRKIKGASLLAAGALLGVVSAGAVGAYAAGNDSGSSSSSSTPSPGTASSPSKDADGPENGRGNGRGGGHAGETALTGSNLAKATAAAKGAVSGGTVDRAETDSGDSPYEVHMTKSDGTKVTVKLDKSFAVRAVEDGMGK